MGIEAGYTTLFKNFLGQKIKEWPNNNGVKRCSSTFKQIKEQGVFYFEGFSMLYRRVLHIPHNSNLYRQVPVFWMVEMNNAQLELGMNVLFMMGERCFE